MTALPFADEITLSQREIHTLQKRLLDWYKEAKRDLPWRRTNDPYRIWVSEVMLQQTRVEAVIKHYTRFLERFPTLRALAAADEAEVLDAWAGLGYGEALCGLRSLGGACVGLPLWLERYERDVVLDDPGAKRVAALGHAVEGRRGQEPKDLGQDERARQVPGPASACAFVVDRVKRRKADRFDQVTGHGEQALRFVFQRMDTGEQIVALFRYFCEVGGGCFSGCVPEKTPEQNAQGSPVFARCLAGVRQRRFEILDLRHGYEIACDDRNALAVVAAPPEVHEAERSHRDPLEEDHETA